MVEKGKKTKWRRSLRKNITFLLPEWVGLLLAYHRLALKSSFREKLIAASIAAAREVKKWSTGT